MSTTVYTQVRGSAIRATALGPRGAIPSSGITYVASKAVTSIQIAEVTEAGKTELLRTDLSQKPRVLLNQADQTVSWTLGIEFTRVDPGLLNIMSAVPTVTNYAGDIVGIDAQTRLPIKSFALEVWSKLSAAQAGTGSSTSGTTGLFPGPTLYPGSDVFPSPSVAANSGRTWGYTLFPYLRGGYMTGIKFGSGLVSFSVVGAKTRRYPKWGVGPYDLTGAWQRLVTPVSGNTHWRQGLVASDPPAQTNGVQTFLDVIEGGNATTSTSDVIEGGDAFTTTPWIIDGGQA